MPALAPPVADERSALAAFLRQQQDAFRAAIYGLTDEQAGRAPTPSTLTVGTLVKHVTGGQRAWLEQARAAPAPAPRGASEQWQRDWTWLPQDTVAGVLAAYDEVCRAVQDAVAALELDTLVPVPDAPWFPKDIPGWSVRWVWFHLIEELARHAGHADIVREAVDGATMFELVAGMEGWPATPWLTPWQPPVG